MKKRTINTAVFFTILIWLVFYILGVKHRILFKDLTAVVWAVAIGLNLVVIAAAKFLIPVFELVLKGTGKIGSLIFGLITTLVYFFILTPIALFKRFTGSKLMDVKFDGERESYYDEWEPSENIEKQF
jgi:hypothetical protein